MTTTHRQIARYDDLAAQVSAALARGDDSAAADLAAAFASELGLTRAA